jgi:hypothetical protein
MVGFKDVRDCGRLEGLKKVVRMLEDGINLSVMEKQ